MFLNDEGLSGDVFPGDGIYSTLFQIPTEVPPGQYKLHVVAADTIGQTSEPWPELRVKP